MAIALLLSPVEGNRRDARYGTPPRDRRTVGTTGSARTSPSASFETGRQAGALRARGAAISGVRTGEVIGVARTSHGDQRGPRSQQCDCRIDSARSVEIRSPCRVTRVPGFETTLTN